MSLKIEIGRGLKEEHRKGASSEYEDISLLTDINFLYRYFAGHPSGENCIHNTPITKEEIEYLVEDCTLVLEDHSMCTELLPTTDHFLFVPSKYNNNYFKGVKNVLDVFQEILKNYNDNYIYSITFTY